MSNLEDWGWLDDILLTAKEMFPSGLKSYDQHVYIERGVLFKELNVIYVNFAGGYYEN
jgi:hypothetical protein